MRRFNATNTRDARQTDAILGQFNQIIILGLQCDCFTSYTFIKICRSILVHTAELYANPVIISFI